MKNETNIEQEIKWLEEEIESDEFVMSSKDGSSFFQERIDNNKEKLRELLDAKSPPDTASKYNRTKKQ